MPYIVQERRVFLQRSLQDLMDDMDSLNTLSGPLVAGDLNYIVSKLALAYITVRGTGYNNISDAIKALTGAAHEIERRVLDPYEDECIKKNGDIL